MVTKITGRQYLICAQCGDEEVEVPADVSKVTCAYCVQKMVAPPEEVREKSDKPRGWHFKAYFEHNGVVYSKGQEVTDPDEIVRLKKGLKKTKQVTAGKKSTSTVKRGRKNARSSK
jgi:hypothetical protein